MEEELLEVAALIREEFERAMADEIRQNELREQARTCPVMEGR